MMRSSLCTRVQISLDLDYRLYKKQIFANNCKLDQMHTLTASIMFDATDHFL